MAWVLALAGLLLLALAVLIAWLVSGATSPPTTSGTQPRPALRVSQTVPDAYRSVGEALRNATAGDRVVVHDEVIRETLDGRRVPRDVTVEPAKDLAKPVRWCLPEKSKAEQVLLLNGLDGLTIKGVTFDGEGRARDAVVLTGNCPGLTLEDVVLRGFKRSGLLIMNCTGSSSRPVSLVRVRVVTEKDAEAAFSFELSKDLREPKINQHIVCRDCRYEGAFKTATKVAEGANQDVVLPEWNRR